MVCWIVYFRDSSKEWLAWTFDTEDLARQYVATICEIQPPGFMTAYRIQRCVVEEFGEWQSCVCTGVGPAPEETL
jgi:hypothetical protein